MGVQEVQYRLSTGKFGERKKPVVEMWLADVMSGAAIADELFELSERFAALQTKFVEGGSFSGLFLKSEDASDFEALFTTTIALLSSERQDINLFRSRIVAAYNEDVGGMMGGPSLNCVMKISKLVSNSAELLARQPHAIAKALSTTDADNVYVSVERIEQLREVHSPQWDLSKLIRLCEELNGAFQNQNYFSVGMLVRAIMDHLPPVFGQSSFGQLAAQHGGKSFKGSMDHLQKSMRHISDNFLHEHIKKKISLPNRIQVDVRRELDVLLSEVINNYIG